MSSRARVFPVLIVLGVGLMAALAGCQTHCHCGEPAQPPPSAGASIQPPLEIKRRAFDGSKEPFAPHPNYVALTLPFPPMKALYDQLSKSTEPLITRGESHVTILTPPELESLGGRVSIDTINRLVSERNLQRSRLEPVCVGEGRAMIDGKIEKTYFVVLRSPELVELRRQVARLAERPGAAQLAHTFEPEHFYPHVTIGFTKTDLHEQNGVIKDEKSCRSSLRVID